MKTNHSRSKLLLLSAVALMTAVTGWAIPPLKLLRRIPMPQVSFDGPGSRELDAIVADVETNRLFIAAEWHGSIEVYDLKTLQHIHSINGIGRPLDIVFSPVSNRIYVSDCTGEPTQGFGKFGGVRIYDGTTYEPIKMTKLLPDSDSIGYDESAKKLYVKNGGEDAGLSYSFVSVLNLEGDKVDEIKIDSDTIGDVCLEDGGPRFFIPDSDKKRHTKVIRVFDRNTRQQLATFQDPHGTHDGVLEIDERHHRLFAGEPEGSITVFDTESGREVASLPIGKGMDGIMFDDRAKRIYATCGGDGQIYAYQEVDPDRFESLGKVESGPKARGGTIVPEIKRFFTAVPQQGDKPCVLLEYELQ